MRRIKSSTFNLRTDKIKCKAIVVYDTRFGNTKKVNEALTRGILKHNIDVKYVSVEDVKLDKLGKYDLIAIGAPTHFNLNWGCCCA
jgi:flavorubredoxin